MGKKELVTLIVFLMSCDCYCSVVLLHGAIGRSAVCDRGSSLPYSLTFLHIDM